MSDLTQKRLRELLCYCPLSGVFIRKNSAGRVKKGDVTGSRHCKGYLEICVTGRRFLAHRLAFLYMKGAFPPEQVDHINHVRNDNRWSNLRPVNSRTNSMNMSLRASNTSGTAGVYWHKRAGKWAAYITIRGRVRYLGVFKKIEDAVKARKASERKYGFHPNHGTAFTLNAADTDTLAERIASRFTEDMI